MKNLNKSGVIFFLLAIYCLGIGNVASFNLGTITTPADLSETVSSSASAQHSYHTAAAYSIVSIVHAQQKQNLKQSSFSEWPLSGFLAYLQHNGMAEIQKKGRNLLLSQSIRVLIFPFHNFFG